MLVEIAVLDQHRFTYLPFQAILVSLVFFNPRFYFNFTFYLRRFYHLRPWNLGLEPWAGLGVLPRFHLVLEFVHVWKSLEDVSNAGRSLFHGDCVVNPRVEVGELVPPVLGKVVLLNLQLV